MFAALLLLSAHGRAGIFWGFEVWPAAARDGMLERAATKEPTQMSPFVVLAARRRPCWPPPRAQAGQLVIRHQLEGAGCARRLLTRRWPTAPTAYRLT